MRSLIGIVRSFLSRFSIFPSILFVIGGILLFSVATPLIYWQLKYGNMIRGESLASPVTRYVFSPREENGETRILKDNQESSEMTYAITIEKLGIFDAEVRVGGENLDESLIQFPNTAPPGTVGNTVVFGHSSLPIMPQNSSYKAVFSKLHRLTKGDIIRVKYDGVAYVYRIEDRRLVKPTDFSVLEQSATERELSLITCVPPGLDLERLVVKAKLLGT